MLFGCAFYSAGDSPSNTQTWIDCPQETFKHSDGDLNAMTAARLFDEMVKEQTFHPATSWEHEDDYGSRLHAVAARRGSKMLPEFTKGLDSYDPGKPSECNDSARVGFFIASATASDIDNWVARLRSTEDGRQVIAAIERGVKRMTMAGFDDANHKLHGLYGLTSHHAEMARGTNIHDEILVYTLKERHKIDLSKSEQLAFSNFLTSLDPSYPSWSRTDSVNFPSQLKDTRRYLSAYRQFIKK